MNVQPMERGRRSPAPRQWSRYRTPDEIATVGLNALIAQLGRGEIERKQLDFLGSKSGDAQIYYAGDLSALDRPAVSIVGTRDVSPEGRVRAERLARELVDAGVTIVSGLAKGVDTAAMTSAVQAGGRVVGVIGTPLDKAYPAENASLQEQVYAEHLLLTPFRIGEQTFKGNFPKRNRVMAAISDATVIIEASDTSGTLHQAAECGRLKRWLFILRSVADDPKLTWPKSFLGQPRVAVLRETQDILDVIRA